MIMPIIRISLKSQSPLTNSSAPRCWHLEQGGKWNSERHLVIRHVDLTLWLWKLIPVINQRNQQFSPLALWKKDNGRGKQISTLFLLPFVASKGQPTKRSLRTVQSGKKPVWEGRREHVSRGLLVIQTLAYSLTLLF